MVPGWASMRAKGPRRRPASFDGVGRAHGQTERMNRVVAIVGVVGLLAALGAVLWWRSGTPERSPGGPVVSVNSAPAGAAILIAGKEVGRTPWFADNVWPSVPVAFELVLPGYRRAEGTFMGGVEARVELVLVRAKPKRVRVSDAGVVVDAGVLEVELDDDGDDFEVERHKVGPLRPRAPEFKDEDLDKEAGEARVK